MADINFPNTSSINDTYTFQDRTWVYNGIGWAVKTYSISNTDITSALGYTPYANTGGTLNGSITVNQAINEKKTAPSISSNTLTLDCSLGNVFSVSLNANITTLTFTNVPSSGVAYGLTLSLIADGTARTVTWGGSVKWPSATAPTLTSTNGKADTFVLVTWDGGTTWYAFVSGQNS